MKIIAFTILVLTGMLIAYRAVTSDTRPTHRMRECEWNLYSNASQTVFWPECDIVEVSK